MHGSRDPKSRLWTVNLKQKMNTKIAQCNHAHDNNNQKDLINYLQATCFSPVKSTCITAIKNGNFSTWPGLNEHSVEKYMYKSTSTAKGHLNQEIKNARTTKTKEALRKSMHRRACAHRCACYSFKIQRYNDIDWIVSMNVHYKDYIRQWRLRVMYLSLLDLLNWQLAMAIFLRGKKGIWLPKKGLERSIHVCTKEPNGQAVYVDVKLLGTTEGLYQNSDTIVLLHEYCRCWVHLSWTYDIMAQSLWYMWCLAMLGCDLSHF
jgi:hypothetical protein